MKITIEYNGLKFEVVVDDVSNRYYNDIISIITQSVQEGLKLIEKVNTNPNE